MLFQEIRPEPILVLNIILTYVLKVITGNECSLRIPITSNIGHVMLCDLFVYVLLLLLFVQ